MAIFDFFFEFFFWIGAGLLVLAAGVRMRRNRREEISDVPGVDDDDIRRILETGVLAREEDEPLDLEEIEEEERRFWEESEWDQAEEF